jgi:Ca-activated chloride channel family protein
MSVDHPQVLWFLLGLLPLAALQYAQYRSGRRDLAMLTGERSESVLTVYLVKWFFSSLFFLLFVAFSILALAGFSWGQESVEENREGLDVVVAVDVSKSMLATDAGETSRVARAREILRGLVQELHDARVGVVVFSGRGLTAVPVTEDRVAVDSFLAALGTEVMSAEGSSLEQGLGTAFAAVPEGTNRNRVIVLLSDGEQHSGNPLRTAEVAGSAGVPVFTVTLGSEAGSTIPLEDGTRLTDRQGNVVLTRAEPRIMEEIAAATDGSAFRLGQGEAFGPLLREIRTFENRREREGFRLVAVPRYRLFLIAAVIAVALHVFVRVFRWRGII